MRGGQEPCATLAQTSAPEPPPQLECAYCPRKFTSQDEREHHQAKVCRFRPTPESVPLPPLEFEEPAPAPRRFVKVELPAKASAVRLTASMIGEVVDTAGGAFAAEDEAARQRLEAALAAEDTTRFEKTCPGCGDRFFARTDTREFCLTCTARPHTRRLTTTTTEGAGA